MKPLSTAASVESDDFPDRFSETWERRSSTDTRDRDVDHEDQSGLLSKCRRLLPCDRCWTSLIASATITIFIVGGVLLIVALLVRHHDDQMEKLERSRDAVISPPSIVKVLPITKGAIANDPEVATDSTSHPITNDPNFCTSKPCLNGGTCLNESANASCLCPQGYSGRFCANGGANTKRATLKIVSTVLTIPDDAVCSVRPCLNGGRCYVATSDCHCQRNFTGRFCQNPSKGICASSPCLYDTKCEEIDNGLDFKCTCPIGFTGKRCEQVTCGSNITLTATPSPNVIATPDYPYDRLQFLNCTWTIVARYYFIKLSFEDVRLNGDSCQESSIDIYDNSTRVLINRLCPSNASFAKTIETSVRSILIRYTVQPSSFFSMSYASPNIDPCLHFNKANCTHGKCWPDETKATCVCDPCYRGAGCSEIDEGDCSDTYCANGGTCFYNCYLQTKRCECSKEYDPRTNCVKKCADTGRC